MALAIKHMPPHLSYVSTLPGITQKPIHGIDELKQRLIDTWDRIPQDIIHESVANMAACMCKGKGTSLRTPTVI